MRLTSRMTVGGAERLVELERAKGVYWIARLPGRPETEVSGRTAQDAVAALEKRLRSLRLMGDDEALR